MSHEHRTLFFRQLAQRPLQFFEEAFACILDFRIGALRWNQILDRHPLPVTALNHGVAEPYGLPPAKEIDDAEAAARAEIERAVEAAREMPWPDPKLAWSDVQDTGGPAWR